MAASTGLSAGIGAERLRPLKISINGVRGIVGETLTPDLIVDFAHAFGITLETLHDWEAGRSRPDGPALSLMRVAARHPRAVRENVSSAA